MCSCGPPSPVFLKPPDWPSPFLNDLVGAQLADKLRSLFGTPSHPDSPYGIICSCGGDSYLGASLSSLWAFLVVLISFTAGMTFLFKKKVAYWMLGIGAAVSILDTGIRVAHRLGRPAPYSQIMVGNLPGQIAANAVFQFAVPLAAGFTVALLAEGLRRLVAAGSARLSRTR